jgi:hypothetical protein
MSQILICVIIPHRSITDGQMLVSASCKKNLLVIYFLWVGIYGYNAAPLCLKLDSPNLNYESEHALPYTI